MAFSRWNINLERAFIATAVHNGHELRREVAEAITIDESTRLREEDPHTGTLASHLESYVIVDRSRFEVDLNRPPEEAVYTRPEHSWGIEVWAEPPDEDLVRRSRAQHHDFYSQLRRVLEQLVERHGGFVLFDVHSYNHRRAGPDHAPEDPADNPLINVGTGSLPPKWRPVAEAFVTSLRRQRVAGEFLDVRENVRFRGRYVAQFVHDNFGGVGCALAIEIKKVFMDEWTHQLDEARLAQLGATLAETAGPVLEAWETACR
ncbi:MAG TPA: N-formylglutamate amidohydrolase [Acidimicrobiia bacterium]|nr:N-formylglutamate amidohydrolase [Acidimicrobiia bacterium]